MKKDFNTYKEGLDLEVLRAYCMEHGERRTFERGDIFEAEGAVARLFGYVKSGSFHYLVRN